MSTPPSAVPPRLPRCLSFCCKTPPFAFNHIRIWRQTVTPRTHLSGLLFPRRASRLSVFASLLVSCCCRCPESQVSSSSRGVVHSPPYMENKPALFFLKKTPLQTSVLIRWFVSVKELRKSIYPYKVQRCDVRLVSESSRVILALIIGFIDFGGSTSINQYLNMKSGLGNSI